MTNSNNKANGNTPQDSELDGSGFSDTEFDELMEVLRSDDYPQVYKALTNLYHNSVVNRARQCIDIGELGELWQTPDDRPNEAPDNVLGWLYALSVMQDQVAAKQARWEMVAACEHTQFANELAMEISDVAADIRASASRLVTLHCHYRAILQGRGSYNVNYTSADGEWVPLEFVNEACDTSAARLFNAERRRSEINIRRQPTLEYMDFAEDTYTFLSELLRDRVLPQTATTGPAS